MSKDKIKKDEMQDGPPETSNNLVYGKPDSHGKIVFSDGRKFNLNRLPADCLISIPAVEMGGSQETTR